MDVKSEDTDRTNGANPNKKKTKKKNKSKKDGIDVINDKLEKCLHINQNGVTNVNGNSSSPDSKDHREHPHENSVNSKKKHKNKKPKSDEIAQEKSTELVDDAQHKENETDIKVPSLSNIVDIKTLDVEKGQVQQTDDGNININNNVYKLSNSNNLERSHADASNVNNAKEDKEVPSTSSSISLPQPTLTSTNETNTAALAAAESQPNNIVIEYKEYESELQMPDIMALIQKDLSEPYSIYTYRYFIHNWPKLCFLALHNDMCVGAIVCKLDIHRQNVRRGYIAMLAVDKNYRKLKIGTTLVQKAIMAMLLDNADEVVLETEITNQPALRLYENLGFVRDKRLFHYYLNGVDALRLKLWFR